MSFHFLQDWSRIFIFFFVIFLKDQLRLSQSTLSFLSVVDFFFDSGVREIRWRLRTKGSGRVSSFVFWVMLSDALSETGSEAQESADFLFCEADTTGWEYFCREVSGRVESKGAEMGHDLFDII